ncbi:putative reverse transcriptase domain-containing protein [Tanacetum coccineum]
MVQETEPSTIQSAILKACGLTDDATRNGLLKKGSEKKKDGGETRKQEDVRVNNKRARTIKGFVVANYYKKEYKGPHHKCVKCNYRHQETTPCRTCFNCNQPGYAVRDCRAIAKWVTLVKSINMLEEVRFLGHVVNKEGIHVDPSKIEAMNNLKAPSTPLEICQFLGLAGQGIRSVLMQRGKVITYASRKLKVHEKKYTTHDLELGAKSLQHIFDKKELNMRQRWWIKLFSNYDCEIRYHPGKENVLAITLSRKERVKLVRVWAMSMTICSNIKSKILEAQREAFKEVNMQGETLQGLDKQMECKEDHIMYYVG